MGANIKESLPSIAAILPDTPASALLGKVHCTFVHRAVVVPLQREQRYTY